MPIIKTRSCLVCGKAGTVELTDEEFEAYTNNDGRHIQDVLPHLSIAEREMLISGTHSDCFDSLYADSEFGDDEE